MEMEIVTPLAGVWVEIMLLTEGWDCPSSLPLRECGLKYIGLFYDGGEIMSLPLRECGLKFLPDNSRKIYSARHSPCGSVG